MPPSHLEVGVIAPAVLGLTGITSPGPRIELSSSIELLVLGLALNIPWRLYPKLNFIIGMSL